METRLRLIIVRGGLPRPQAQWVVQDEQARTAVWLDLAYPEHRIGVEYDGAVHTAPGAVLRDIARHTALLDQGWRVHRYTKVDVLHRPDRIVAQLSRALAGSKGP
jgi:very-short-patch-repair endonuclease